jgi:hypothetical protein
MDYVLNIEMFLELFTVGKSSIKKPRTDHNLDSSYRMKHYWVCPPHTIQCEHKESGATSAPNMDLDNHDIPL